MTRSMLACAALVAAGCTANVSDPDTNGGCEELPSQSHCDNEIVLDDCDLAGVDEVGSCVAADALMRCTGGKPVLEMCSPDSACVEDEAGPQCLSSADACGDIGPQGRCDDDVLVSCVTGWPLETDCAASSEVCAYADDTLGYQCLAIATAGAHRVRGRVAYEDRPISPGAIGDITPLPVRGANVWLLRDGDDAVLAHAVTANDGRYTLRTDADAGTSARVTLTTSSQVAVRPLRVTRSSGNSHAFGGASFALAGQQNVDVLVTEVSGAAPAFNIFDNLILGMDYARSLGATEISELTARWQRGAGGGSYYQGASNFLNIAGGADDDGYDDVVVLHEFGHHHQDEYGGTDNPGGPHPSSGGDDPRLAWAEGQATYIAMMLTRQPYYIDTNFADGGWFVELEDNVHGANMNGSMRQLLLEWMVAELLWDVGDNGSGDQDGDPVMATHDEVMQITTTYFHDAAYVGRGVAGYDLVDWLDGWFWRQGLASCASMKALVRDVFGFPYDFGACE